MITLAIASQKGGVGKTTVSINLAYALAKRGWKTLLMDTDPQGSVGLSLSEKARKRKGFYDIVGDGKGIERILVSTKIPELKILTAGKPRNYFDVKPKEGDSKAAVARILASAEERGHQITVVDTAAGLGGYTEDVLKLCDYVLIPQQSEPLGVRSVPTILQAVQHLRNTGHKLELAGILLTMLAEDQKESAEVARELRSIIPPKLLFQTAVPRDEGFLRASAVGIPLGLLYKNPPASALAFEKIAAELEIKMGLASDDGEEGSGALLD